MAERSFETVIVGAGPAGIAVLLAASRSGRLAELLDRGIAIVEKTQYFGAGQIGSYAINSDSTAATFIDCIKHSSWPELASLKKHPLTVEFAAADQDAVPLHLVGQMSLLIGESLRRIIASHPACAVHLNSRVSAARQEQPNIWSTMVSARNGRTVELVSRNLVIATGGSQPKARLADETVGGQNLQAQCTGRLIQSGEVFRDGGLDDIASRLDGKSDPKIVVLGGSTSAVAVAHSLLNRLRPPLTGINAVSLLHRRPLRIYYPSVAEARSDGYNEFTDNDICPLTKRVFRFAGLRLDSKTLLCQALRVGGRLPDPRLRLHQLQAYDPDAMRMIADADLVIACFGYRPIALPLEDENGRSIKLHVHKSMCAPLVDGHCRVLDEQGRPLKNLFGIGLASGFIPRGALGGEPSFSGQANGLWLWQTAVGGLIIDQILQAPAAKRVRHGRAERGVLAYQSNHAPHMKAAQNGVVHRGLQEQ